MKITAIVVTYNRKLLLGECLNSLLNQTYPLDAIYIIDNASTDGTLEYLVVKGFIDKPLFPDKEPLEVLKQIPLLPFPDKTVEIHYVRMHENTGSAGGFHEGIKRGYKNDFDWLWLMDDDGEPNNNALQKLIEGYKTMPNGKVFNSLVVDKNDPDKIPFGYHFGFNIMEKKAIEEKKYKSFFSVAELKSFAPSICCEGLSQFFNSTLIHRGVIEDVGYPIRGFFIRGEEEEYIFRIQNAGYITYTVLNSIIYHPFPEIKEKILFGYKMRYEKMNDFKKYYVIRNKIWQAKYYPHIIQNKSILKILAKEVIVSLFEKQSFLQIIATVKTIAKAYIDANKLTVNIGG